MLKEISVEKDNYGSSKSNNKKVLIEYVSSNPTGPLHVGHGRGAVFGSVCRLLSEAGFKVDEEYYVNDFGRQMNILAASLWIRYAQIFNSELKMFKNGYQGEYLKSIAQQLKEQKSDGLFLSDLDLNDLLDRINKMMKVLQIQLLKQLDLGLEMNLYLLEILLFKKF